MNTSRSRRGSLPSMRTVPWLTSMRPVIARMSVVLPAPFGPSRPVTPGPNEQLSSDSATFWPEPHRHVGDRRPSRRRRTPGRRRAAASGRATTSSFHPAVAAQEHRDCRRATPRRTSTTANSPPLLDARRAATCGSMWPRNTRSRRYSGSREHVDRARPASRRSNSKLSPTKMPDAIDVTRKSPMIDAPATIRRSVSDEIATPIDGVVHGEQRDRERHLPRARRDGR